MKSYCVHKGLDAACHLSACPPMQRQYPSSLRGLRGEKEPFLGRFAKSGSLSKILQNVGASKALPNNEFWRVPKWQVGDDWWLGGQGGCITEEHCTHCPY